MNPIICKYVNASNLISNTRKCMKSQIRSNEFCTVTTTGLRHTLDDVAKKFNFNHLNDWYKLPLKVQRQRDSIKIKDYSKVLGDQFEKEYNSSPIQLLSSAYPEQEWLPWKFSRCPTTYWDDISNVRKFMDWAGNQLNIKEMSDWYNISSQVILKSLILINQSF